jgi:hypothetical protein
MWFDMAAGDDIPLEGRNSDGLYGRSNGNAKEKEAALSTIEGSDRRSVSVSTGYNRQMKTSLPATHQEQSASQKSATIPGVLAGREKRHSEWIHAVSCILGGESSTVAN